jgi:rubredoxin
MSRWRCPSCGYTYDEQHGKPREGFPPGTSWSEVPNDWACPDCGVRDKVDFQEQREEEGEEGLARPAEGREPRERTP